MRDTSELVSIFKSQKEFIMAKIEKLNEELTELKSRYEKASDRIKALKEKLKESILVIALCGTQML